MNMNQMARGYIASGVFNGIRAPQHQQNQIIKQYCDVNNLRFVMSRAEYWINGSTKCQLWAALKEEYSHIVFFSVWQLPKNTSERESIYNYSIAHAKRLHFATERMEIATTKEAFNELELLIRTNLSIISQRDRENYLNILKRLI